jgi:hypothetical protein
MYFAFFCYTSLYHNTKIYNTDCYFRTEISIHHFCIKLLHYFHTDYSFATVLLEINKNAGLKLRNMAYYCCRKSEIPYEAFNDNI